MRHLPHRFQFAHVAPGEGGFQGQRDAVLDQRLNAGAAARITAGSAGDRFVSGGGGAVERNFGAAGRCLRQARRDGFGDEHAVGVYGQDETHPREGGINIEKVGAQEDLTAGEE